MDFSFDCFSKDSFFKTNSKKCMKLFNANADIGGGTITVEDIDVLAEHPEVDTVSITGLNQQTFEYFITKYGCRLKAIKFFKNKKIEDLSPLGALSQLEYLDLFFNQKVTKLWDMSNNTALSALSIKDFSRLKSINGIETAPNLKHFIIGNAIWDKAVIESFMPLSNTSIEILEFCGKAILDNDLSFLYAMQKLKEFDFATNFYTTEQVAWIASNFPHLSGFAIKAKVDCMLGDSKLYNESGEWKEVPSAIIVGKRKPSLNIVGNEARIAKYETKFEELKKEYKGKEYKELFKINAF